MRIQVLPQNLINQIAAGEVVVRMASVVKELVENSIDAGASRIEVRLSNKVRDLEVRDDGAGMSREDAEMCLQRHATSKIKEVEDLFNLQTRGFRGEAIPSIASVSRMEIQTREPEALNGTRMIVEGGRIQRIEAMGCPPGTRMIVRDLFFDTPARLKFLKSPASEINAVMLIVMRQALAQPHIGFLVERDGRAAMELPAGQDPVERFRSVLASQVKHEAFPLEFERGEIRVTGVLGHPEDAAHNRRHQFFFVNSRPFTSKTLSAAFENGCRGFIMVGRFPITAVFIEMPASEVDFNVHPTKEEVRFQDERSVAGAVYHAAQEALKGAPALVGEVRLKEQEESEQSVEDGQAEDSSPAGSPSAKTSVPSFFTSPQSLVQRAFEKKQARQAQQSDWLMAPRPEGKEEANAPAPRSRSRLRPAREDHGGVVAAAPGERPDDDFWSLAIDPEPLGQIAETYILVQYGEDLLIVDQHASHERLVYLQLKRRQQLPDQQSLLVPIMMELPANQSEQMHDLIPFLAEQGFEVEEFGPRTWAVKSLPADLPEFDVTRLLMDLIEDISEAERVDALEDFRDRILIRTACHSAIRAGQQLPMAQMRELLRQIRGEKLSFTCPHGRPTIQRLSKRELDKQFRRIV